LENKIGRDLKWEEHRDPTVATVVVIALVNEMETEEATELGKMVGKLVNSPWKTNVAPWKTKVALK
jgi:hypothetical protein